MPHTPLPAPPMLRISEPGDIGRVLRFAGRMGHQVSLSGARMRDLTDVVRTLAISLILDAPGGWISVHELAGTPSPGLEVVAFDRRPEPGTAEAEQGDPASRDWSHLRSQLRSLGDLGAAVSVQATPAGGTAMCARILDEAADGAGGAGGAGRPTGADVEVSGLLQAPPGEPPVGWTAFTSEERVCVVVCEARADGSRAAAKAQQLLRLPPGPTPAATLEAYRAMLGPLHDVAAAVVDLDLADRAVSAASVGGVALHLAVDDAVALLPTTGRSTGPGVPDQPPVRELTLRWDRSLRLLAHTTGIRRGEATLPAAAAAHPVLTCAASMRDQREPTPAACVVAARVTALAVG